MAENQSNSPNYQASDIQVLKGLDPVRALPGMYTRTESPTHILQEVLDNAADEALAGYAKTLTVEVFADGSVSVQDDGRGIPTDMHPEEGVPAAQLVFTQLHAGGKFRKGGTYSFSGGLHGVGVSVTNALSLKLEVTVWRDGQTWQMAFENGELSRALAVTGSCAKSRTGTKIRVWPDPKYFDRPGVNVTALAHLLKSKAVLLPGVTAALTRVDGSVETWCYPNGMAEYLQDLLATARAETSAEAESPEADPGLTDVALFSGESYVKAETGEPFAPGEGCAWALAWSDDIRKGESYVNLIPTPLGGTHEAGLKSGIFEAVLAFAGMHGLLPKGVKLQPEDVWSKTSFVLATKVLDPQFQGQTKDQLTSRDALKLVATRIKDPLELWLNATPDAGRRIVEMAVARAMSRMNTAAPLKRRNSGSVVLLPEKLKDCVSSNPAENEVILVEGDSAGGSAVQGRDKETQAVLYLRGKGLNAWETPATELLSNAEIADMATALGIEPHASVDTADLSGLRYGRIIIMTDADVDGSHIQTLLLTLYLRHFPALLHGGYVYVAQPPLYRLDVPAKGKKPARKMYVLDEAELTAAMEKLAKDGIKPETVTVGRFKGLGEMMPAELWESALCPDTRRLLRMQVSPESEANAMATFDLLMRKSKAGERKAWLERRGKS